MKIAHIDLYFKLPDDYESTDLIKLLVTIIEHKSKNKNKVDQSPVVDELKNTKTISKYGYDVMVYNRFMKLVKEKGYKLGGEVRFIEAKSDNISL
jgi:hypothetical protein